MQAAFQRHTDNAVSKTVNFPSNATREDVRSVYLLAYREGLKGVTIYRDGSRTGQVLNIGKVNDGKTAAESAELPENYGKIEPRPRPLLTRGFTEKMNIGCGTLYVTVNYDENGICEVFTSTGKAGGCPSQSEATARLTSIALRSGISINEVYDQLKGIRCPSTIRQKNMSCTSCPDAIARVLMKVSKYIDNGGEQGTPDAQEKTKRADASSSEVPFIPKDNGNEPAAAGEIHFCPECGSRVEHEGGCIICRSCGYSKCG
jgi:ribonucleoside-diphosphate reductase alpha chain